jgi:putative glutathione S-transferase
MGMLIDGVWSQQDQRRANASGEFVRPVSPFRGVIGSSESRFPAQAGRYHLFVNAGCPWAYRTILYRALKGLTQLIGISFTQPAAGTEGWTFGETPEPLLGARHIHDIYTLADPGFTGRATVPVLWDLQSRTIVNNESADIIRMFNHAFDGFDGVANTNYYPDELAGEIDALNNEVYANVNNGVYRCGFAQSQSAYDEAFDSLFGTLDALDARLAGQRYLCGAQITEGWFASTSPITASSAATATA